jgi:hypothetical protein
MKVPPYKNLYWGEVSPHCEGLATVLRSWKYGYNGEGKAFGACFTSCDQINFEKSLKTTNVNYKDYITCNDVCLQNFGGGV